MSVRIVYPTEDLFRSFYEALTEVARERVYLEMIEPPPFEKVAAFQRSLVEKKGPVFYAVDGETVVGWCDAFPVDHPRMKHRASLGMGIVGGYRGKGIGAQLLKAVIEQAKAFGLEKIELHVYTTNAPAIRLYEKVGFEREGLIRKYRQLDGVYYDSLMMSYFL
jgi:RimJ/RimL family protein N-acetyltransferase